MTGHEYPPPIVGGGIQSVGSRARVGEGFLHKDVLPALKGFQCKLIVGCDGRGDYNSVDIGPEQF